MSFDNMTGPELTNAYNEMASKLGEPELGRFKSRSVGVKRCQAMAERVSKWEAGQASEEPEQLEVEEQESSEDVQEQGEAGEAGFDLAEIPEDPAEASAFLHKEFGDPELPSPDQHREVKAQASKVKPAKADKVQPLKNGEVVQVDLSDPGEVFKAFKVREGTNKHRLLKAMIKAMGTQLSLSSLLRATYGSPEAGSEGSLMMVVKGVSVAIEENSLPFKVEKNRINKVLHVGLIYLGPEDDEEPEEDLGSAQDQEATLQGA